MLLSILAIVGEKIDPWHGSYHWIYERILSAATLGLTACAFVSPGCQAIDLGLAFILPLHCHIGFGAVITDYLPSRKFPRIYPVARGALLLATAGTIYGLYKFNTTDVGITRGVSSLWKPSKDLVFKE